MAEFPQTDLPELAQFDEVELYFQNQQIFDHSHQLAENNSHFNKLMHVAMQSTADRLLDSADEARAIELGTMVFEVISQLARPEDSYDSDQELQEIIYGSRLLTRRTDAIKFRARLDFARRRLQQNTPRLYDAVDNISSKLTGHDESATSYALAGAGMMRGLQIGVDERLVESANQTNTNQ